MVYSRCPSTDVIDASAPTDGDATACRHEPRAAIRFEPYRSSTADARSAVRSPTSATRTHSRSRPSVPFGPRSPHDMLGHNFQDGFDEAR